MGQAWLVGVRALRWSDMESKLPHRSSRRMWLMAFWGLVLVGAGVGAYVFRLGDHIQPMLAWIDGLGFWKYGVVVAVYVAACVFLLPGSLLTIPTGFLFGVVRGTATVSVASTLGACAAFWVGRTVARGWIEQKAAGKPRFQAIDQAVGREGFKIVLLTRLSPIFPFNFQNYAYGLTRVSFWKYALASWMGMLPGTVMYVYIGSGLQSLTEATSGEVSGGWVDRAFLFGGLTLAVVVAVLVARVARRALRETTEAEREGAGRDGNDLDSTA